MKPVPSKTKDLTHAFSSSLRPSNKDANRVKEDLKAELQKQLDKLEEPLSVNVDLSLCTDEEIPRMARIINRLAKSEAGRETLEIAAQAGYKFGFLDAAENCFGCCFGGNNYIGLNPVASDDKLVGTLCHECRHAGQGVRMKEIPGRDKLNFASIIRVSRAKEADAQAYALKACKELEIQGDKEPLASFAKFYPPIFAAYEKVFAEQGELNDKVVAGVFKGWYDQTGMKQKYEENYIIKPMHVIIGHWNGIGVYDFERNVDSAKIVEQIGWTKDGNYLAGENPDFLNDPHFLSVGERTKADAFAFFKIREEKTGVKKDASIDAMPTCKDAFARVFPEMGQPVEQQQMSMSSLNTRKKWVAVQAARRAKAMGR